MNSECAQPAQKTRRGSSACRKIECASADNPMRRPSSKLVPAFNVRIYGDLDIGQKSAFGPRLRPLLLGVRKPVEPVTSANGSSVGHERKRT
jgi:hypothetical protein